MGNKLKKLLDYLPLDKEQREFLEGSFKKNPPSDYTLDKIRESFETAVDKASVVVALLKAEAKKKKKRKKK